MIKEIAITKNEDVVKVRVELEKKVLPKTSIHKFSWRDAKNKAKEKYPEVNIEKPLEMKEVLINTDSSLLSGEWIFPIAKKVAPVLEKNKEKTAPPKEHASSIFANKKRGKNSLTKPQNPATVEKTEQSDKPVIVQEPTE